MEYVNNGTLLDKILYHPAGFTKEVSQFYAAQIVIALEYLQSQNIAHRDMKPGNIMIDQNDYIKIIDFGEAKIVDKYKDEEQVIQHIKKQETFSDDSSFFGRMKSMRGKREKSEGTFVGTALYVAPEMLESNQSSFYTDLWALGCIIYEMCSGVKMWKAKNN